MLLFRVQEWAAEPLLSLRIVGGRCHCPQRRRLRAEESEAARGW